MNSFEEGGEGEEEAGFSQQSDAELEGRGWDGVYRTLPTPTLPTQLVSAELIHWGLSLGRGNEGRRRLHLEQG